MKTTIITCAFVFSASVLLAQTVNKNKPVTVRVKKVENINGVEKVTDTTYTTNDPSTLKMGDENIQIHQIGGDKNGKIIIGETEIKMEDGGNMKIIKNGEATDQEIEKVMKELEKTLKEHQINSNTSGDKKTIVVNVDSDENPKSSNKKTTRIVIIKTDVINANDQECKKVGIKQSQNKLVIEDMTCSPNPSIGTFNLKFSSLDKGNTDVTVKDITGKVVYFENINQFDGNYNKEINIGDNTKGIYFVTVTQGNKAITNKLIVK